MRSCNDFLSLLLLNHRQKVQVRASKKCEKSKKIKSVFQILLARGALKSYNVCAFSACFFVRVCYPGADYRNGHVIVQA